MHPPNLPSQPTLPTYPANLPCQPTVPTYPAPQLPCSYAAHVGRLSPPQAAVRFVRSRLGRGFNTWRQHCAEAAALRAAVLRAAVRLQRPRQVAAWERWSEAAAAAAVKEAAEAAAKAEEKPRRKGKGISIGRLLGRRRAPPPAGGSAGPGAAAAAAAEEGLAPAARRGPTLTRLLGPRRRVGRTATTAAAAAAATPDAAANVGVGVGIGDGSVGHGGGGVGERTANGRGSGGNGGGEAGAQEPEEEEDEDDVFGACGDLPSERQTDRKVARQRPEAAAALVGSSLESHGGPRRRRRVAPEP